jgi:putative flippase GtrA
VNRTLKQKFLLFVLVGGLTTGLQYLILAVAVEWLHADSVVSSCFGYLISAILSYWLNYRLTFRSANSHLRAATRFMIISGTGLMLNGVIMYGLVHSWHAPYIFAQLAATGTVLLWNFLGSALWTFAPAAQRAG